MAFDLNEHQMIQAERVALGTTAEEFLNSNIGKYLMNRASMEASNALLELSKVDPDNAAKVRSLQAIIRRCDDLEAWIQEAINIGNSEYQTLSEDLAQDDSQIM